MATQLAIFGVDPILDMHLVSGHERLQADGTSVYVSEHLRWNRGRSTFAPRPRIQGFIPSAGQLSMFTRSSSSDAAVPDEPADDTEMEPIDGVQEDLGFGR